MSYTCIALPVLFVLHHSLWSWPSDLAKSRQVEIGVVLSISNPTAPPTFHNVWNGIIGGEILSRFPLNNLLFVGPTIGYSHFAIDKDVLPFLNTKLHLLHIGGAIGLDFLKIERIQVSFLMDLGYAWMLFREAPSGFRFDDSGALVRPALEAVYGLDTDVSVGMGVSYALVIGRNQIWQEEDGPINFLAYGLRCRWRVE